MPKENDVVFHHFLSKTGEYTGNQKQTLGGTTENRRDGLNWIQIGGSARKKIKELSKKMGGNKKEVKERGFESW
ncbi:hypothetical protein [Aliarcobacter butzleri]|uniref:hypothetical protein n=1 Tax=Aliarcobacter butzleri TaxID=28197 RepID=UPI003AFB0438